MITTEIVIRQGIRLVSDEGVITWKDDKSITAVVTSDEAAGDNQAERDRVSKEGIESALKSIAGGI